MDQRQEDDTGNVYQFNGNMGPTAPSAPRGVIEGSGETVHNDSPSMGDGAYFPDRSHPHHHPHHPRPNQYPPHHNGRAYPSRRDPYDDPSMRPGGARGGGWWGRWSWGRGRRDHYHPINSRSSSHHHHHHHHHTSSRRGWGGRGSYTRWRTDSGKVNPKACCFFLCFVIGFIFIITGGAYLTSSMDFDKRKERIDAYNEYVDNWGYYVSRHVKPNPTPQVTLETQVVCNNRPGGVVNYTLPMNTDITDKITDKHAVQDDALPLKPQYKFTKNMVFKGIVPSHCSIQATIFEGHKAITDQFNVFFAQKTSYQCYWRQSTDPAHDKYVCQQKCQAKGGTFTSETCTYYVSLTDICYKVNLDPYDDSFRLDNYYPSVGHPAQSFGCFYSKKEQEFMALKYKSGVNKNGDIPLTVTIRYSHDPWLGYMRLTGGSGDFGMSVAQKRKFGIGFLAAGGAFLVGCFMMARQKY